MSLGFAAVLLDNREPMPESASVLLDEVLALATFGGIVGAVEGAVLGFPLAGLLGLFRNRS